MDAYRRFINRDLPWEERTCTSKVPFCTRAEAVSVGRGGRRPSGALRPYRCPLGDHWHLGHPKRRHPAVEAVETAPTQRPAASPAGGAAWLSRDWWSTRRCRHVRPSGRDRSWRVAWATA